MRFSIVIPTKERHDTLLYTLKTCLEQDFQDFEIVVSDNCSSSATKEVVDSFQSPRIQYVRTPKLFAMTNNFEYSVSHAQGEYIIVIGDDDGLLPGALSTLDGIINQTQEKAISWEKSYYYWPNMLSAEKRNTASIPAGGQTVRFNGEKMIDNVVNYELYYTLLPMLYHSAVHRDILQELRERTGSVFKSPSPDLYTGFAVAYLAKDYLYLGSPLSVMGLSSKSTGWSFVLRQSEQMDDFDNTNKADNISYHPDSLEFPALVAAIVDCFRYAKEALFPERADLTYNEECFLITAMLDNMRPHEKEKNITLIRKYLTKKPQLLKWFNSTVLPNLNQLRTQIGGPPPSCVSQTIFTLNVYEAYQISNILEFTRSYQQILSEQLQKAALAS